MAEIERQGFEVRLAYHERWPSVSLSPYLLKQTASSDETQAGLGLSIPLPLWNRNRGKIHSAEAQQVQAKAQLESEIRKLERDVASSASAYRLHLEELGKWPPDTLERFRQSAHEADEQYRLGALTVNTYTELQKQYIDSVAAVLETRADILRARTELEQLTGTALDAGEIRVP